MFSNHPLLHQFPQNPFGTYYQYPLEMWRFHFQNEFCQNTPIFASFSQVARNHHQMVLQELRKNLEVEKGVQRKKQAQKGERQLENNGQISISTKQMIVDLSKISKQPNQSKPKHKQHKRKAKSDIRDKAYVAKQYPKQQPSVKCRYIQKNFELNIINQVFSFLWTQQKSSKYVKRFLKQDIKVSLFYENIKTVRKFSKRYINKEYLKNLCDYQPHHIAYKMVTKNPQKLLCLGMKEFSFCIRHLIFIYLHQLCPQAILTSRKMRREIWGEHLSKCRLLKNFLFYNMCPQEYERELIGRNDNTKAVQSTSEEPEH